MPFDWSVKYWHTLVEPLVYCETNVALELDIFLSEYCTRIIGMRGEPTVGTCVAPTLRGAFALAEFLLS